MKIIATIFCFFLKISQKILVFNYGYLSVHMGTYGYRMGIGVHDRAHNRYISIHDVHKPVTICTIHITFSTHNRYKEVKYYCDFVTAM